jgi:hypothetical protein
MNPEASGLGSAKTQEKRVELSSGVKPKEKERCPDIFAT